MGLSIGNGLGTDRDTLIRHRMHSRRAWLQRGLGREVTGGGEGRTGGGGGTAVGSAAMFPGRRMGVPNTEEPPLARKPYWTPPPLTQFPRNHTPNFVVPQWSLFSK